LAPTQKPRDVCFRAAIGSIAEHQTQPDSRRAGREVQSRLQAALKRGLQTRDAELDLARLLGDLADR
jgi:hypothetical protein